MATACIFICIPHSPSLSLSLPHPLLHCAISLFMCAFSASFLAVPPPPTTAAEICHFSFDSFFFMLLPSLLSVCVCVSFTVSFVLFCNYGHVCAAKFYVHARCKAQFKARQIVRERQRRRDRERKREGTDALIATCTTFAQWHPSVLYGATIYG